MLPALGFRDTLTAGCPAQETTPPLSAQARAPLGSGCAPPCLTSTQPWEFTRPEAASPAQMLTASTVTRVPRVMSSRLTVTCQAGQRVQGEGRQTFSSAGMLLLEDGSCQPKVIPCLETKTGQYIRHLRGRPTLPVLRDRRGCLEVQLLHGEPFPLCLLSAGPQLSLCPREPTLKPQGG